MRFAVLEHHTKEGFHWDFLAQRPGGSLRTWSLSTPPDHQSVGLATPLPDHRTVYLTYEGVVYPGRGFVRRWDSGSFELLVDREHLYRALVRGERLRGVVEFEPFERFVEEVDRYRYRPVC
ncbi:ATP-dependent DNA ligase [Planctomycetes bacterium Pan216]|uniref:ATP-dependent DNA ligase n=1 Tax=Kolteria novifilia TaxID=2527975 RepID=A0A518AX05_9BACT|nr:ATP-dependent DNA ligase [Planctomycetes bacterium Pan216]